MLKSAAWGNLTNAARVAYIHLKGKCVSFDQNEVTLSFKEMERIMNRHTYSRSLDQLEQCGFITRIQRGGLQRKRNYFRFNDDWKKIDSSAHIATVTSAHNGTVRP